MGELSPLGVPQMMVIIAVMGFALWKQGWIRVILSLCLIIWGAFAVGYDMKIAAPLIAIGAMLLFMATLRLIQNYRKQDVM
jgi:hypothetical protein